MGQVVVGIGYGDEGKGLTTSFLCSLAQRPIVVRFNGGHQAGHTVVYEGKRHVFSGFGSGTLQGVPTYWSKFCTFYPSSFLREYKLLKKSVDFPQIFVNPLCPVTTPFDIESNRMREKLVNHGSVGMGFGSTIQRQDDYYKLFVQDLYYPNVLLAKLKLIAKYYNFTDPGAEIARFMSHVDSVKDIILLMNDDILNNYNPIFEGAQGVLLDMDHGFFPNVTRSNTISKNALSIQPHSEIYYITRSYSTRHGNGFLHNESKLELVNNENETNKSHPYQGEFRTAKLSEEMLNYALDCDNIYSRGLNKNLVITCLDQYPIDVDDLLSKLNTTFDNVYISKGDSLTNITKYK